MSEKDPNKKEPTKQEKGMRDKLNKFRDKKLSPSEAINQSVSEIDNESATLENKTYTKTNNKKILNIMNKRTRLEDTHTRRTFLVRNDLLKKLDEFSKKTDNSGFKTEFINYVIENGLIEIEEITED